MTTNEHRRSPLDVRVTVTAAGVRIHRLGEVTLDPSEARRLGRSLLLAAAEADVSAARLLAGPGCTVGLDPLADGGVMLRATRAGGQGRWLSEPHPLDGQEFPTADEAARAAEHAGLLQVGEVRR